MSEEDSYQKKSYKKEDTKRAEDVTQAAGYFSVKDTTLLPDQQAVNLLDTLLENHTDIDIAEAIQEYLPTFYTDIQSRTKDKLRILLEAIVNMVGIESFRKAVDNNDAVKGKLETASSRILGNEVVWAGSDASSVSHLYIKAPLSLSTENDKTTIRIQSAGNIHIISKNTNIPKAQFDVKPGDIVTIKDSKEVLMVLRRQPLSQYATSIPEGPLQASTTFSEIPKITQSTYTKST